MPPSVTLRLRTSAAWQRIHLAAETLYLDFKIQTSPPQKRSFQKTTVSSKKVPCDNGICQGKQIHQGCPLSIITLEKDRAH